MDKEPQPSTTSQPATPTKEKSAGLALLGNALVASIFTSTAYLVGVVFHQQYMKALKFNFELYPKNASEYFIYCFVAFFQMFPAWFEAINSSFKIIIFVACFAFLLVLINYISNKLSRSMWVKKHQNGLSGNQKFKILGPFIYIPILSVSLIFYIPLVFGLVMLVPVAVGETMGKKQALKDMANYTKGCEVDLKEADYCTLITEDGKKIALGFVVDASSEYVAVVENGISRSIPIKDKEFSQYVAKIAKSKESK